MLNESGYKDTEGENNRNNDKKYNNTLNELANKALVKTKTQLFSTNTNRLKMYDQAKPKLGSCYAQEWLKKSIESTNDKVTKKTIYTSVINLYIINIYLEHR